MSRLRISLNKVVVFTKSKVIIFYEVIDILLQVIQLYELCKTCILSKESKLTFKKQYIELLLEKKCRLKSFGLTQSCISVGRSCIIECSYKLYNLYDVGLIES